MEQRAQPRLDSDDGSVDSLMRALAKVPSLCPPLHTPTFPPPAGPRQASLPRIGDVLGQRYALRARLGHGGMGVVYAALHLRTQREVAIKVLSPTGSADARRRERVARFVREAHAAGRIRHPNVVDVYDIDADGELFYLVMERLHGESLRSRMARGPLAPEAAVRVLLEAMRGVAAAHRHGVIHRDLKPDNIFLARAADAPAEHEPWLVKVLDFGVSRIVDNEADVERASITGEGQVIGTVAYMPPEQLRGDVHVDARVDVYALGIILYEALSGVRPHRARCERELLARVLSEPPARLRTHVPELDERLEELTMRALARDPAARYPSVESFAVALTAWTERREVIAVEPRPGGRRWFQATAIMLGAIASAWSLAPRTTPPARVRPPVSAGSSATRERQAEAEEPKDTALDAPAPATTTSRNPPEQEDARRRPTSQASTGQERVESARPVEGPNQISPEQRETLLLPSEF